MMEHNSVIDTELAHVSSIHFPLLGVDRWPVSREHIVS